MPPAKHAVLSQKAIFKHSLMFFCNQIITLRNHPPDLLVRDTAVQDNGVPMFFVLMIPRQHRGIGVPPEITPPWINLYIHPNLTVTLIGPGKCPLIFPVPQQHPVIVMKWCINIGIRQGKTIIQDFFSFSHCITSTVRFSNTIFDGIIFHMQGFSDLFHFIVFRYC